MIRSRSVNTPPYTVKSLQRDPNCVLVQDPSAIWGAADHLPRRNLLTYSEDFSNAAWTKNSATVLGGQTVGSYTNSTLLTATAQYGNLCQSVSSTATSFTFSCLASSGNQKWIEIGLTSSSTYTSGCGVLFDLDSGSYSSQRAWGTGYSVTSYSISSAGSGVYSISVTASTPSASAQFPWIGASVNASNGKTVYITNAHCSFVSTLDQSYQKITDWVSEQYTWAAQKNVPWLRRNMLGYTEDLSNAYWLKTRSSIGAGNKLIEDSTANNTHTVQILTSLTVPIGSSFQLVARITPVERTEIALALSSSSTAGKFFTLTGSGSVGGDYGVAPSGASITANGDGSYTCTVTRTTVVTTLNLYLLLVNGGTATYNGDGTSGVIVHSMSISPVENCTYQKITTTWPAEYTSLALAAGYPISMYEDRFGTIATYAPDDTVGIMLDGSEGYALGPNLSGGTMTPEPGWTSLGGGAYSATALQASLAKTIGNSYSYVRCTFTISNYSGGTVRIVYGGLLSTSVSGNGTYTLSVGGTTNNTSLFYLQAVTSFTGTISEISIYAPPGNHSTAPSDAARPNLRLDGNGKWYLDRDTSDDNLPITWPTVLSDSQLGPELITNGSGDSTVGWTAGSSASLSSVSGQLRVTNAGSVYGYAYQTFSTTVGRTYLVTITRSNGTAGANGYRLGTTLAGFEYASDVSSTITQVTKWITATSNTFYLTLYCWSATTTGVYCDYDNISVREVTGTNTIYTATGDYTTKDSNLILSGATNYYYPQRPSGDYGRIVMAADSKYDTKIIKYLDAKRGRSYLLGPELVTNGNFSAWSGDNPTSWTLGFTEDANTYITQASGGAQLVTTGSLASMSQNLGLSSTKSYVFSIGLSSAITGGLKVGYTAGGADVLSAYATIGITQKVISAPTSAYLYITRQSVGVAANITISLVSVREILL